MPEHPEYTITNESTLFDTDKDTAMEGERITVDWAAKKGGAKVVQYVPLVTKTGDESVVVYEGDFIFPQYFTMPAFNVTMSEIEHY